MSCARAARAVTLVRNRHLHIDMAGRRARAPGPAGRTCARVHARARGGCGRSRSAVTGLGKGSSRAKVYNNNYYIILRASWSSCLDRVV